MAIATLAADAASRSLRAISSWWRITSSRMKRRNASVNAGSSPDSAARVAQPGDLLGLAVGVHRRQADLRLVAPDRLGDLEPLGEQVDERGVDVVDARPVRAQLLVDRLGHDRPALR